jgi:glycosyltransferase involved in cell wall biosynthesis
MKIRLLGQRNILGKGTHFAGMVDAMRKLAFIGEWVEEVDPTDVAQFERAVASSSGRDVNIWFLGHPKITSLRGVRVIWAIFEADSLPRDFVGLLNQIAHVVWVPSQWGLDVLVASGVASERIDVVPEGVDPHLYHGHIRHALACAPRPFRFLTVGKFEKRKSYEELLAAFARAFAGQASVELVLKADHFLDHERKKAELTKLVADSGLGNVTLLWGGWQPDRLAALYNHCQAFVFPSRAEAWGLPALEAIASGLPLAAVFYGGATEYLVEVRDSCAEIAYELQPIDDVEFLQHWPDAEGSRSRWARPSVTSLAECLRALHARYDTYREAALRNSLLVRQRFSWASAASKALECLARRRVIQITPGPGE